MSSSSDPSSPSVPLLTDQTMEILESFVRAMQDENYDQIVELAPQVWDRLDRHCEAQAVAIAVYDVYVKALLEQGAFEQVVQLLSGNNKKKSIPPIVWQAVVDRAAPSAPNNNNKNNNAAAAEATALAWEAQRLYAMYRLERYEAAATQAATATNDLAAPPSSQNKKKAAPRNNNSEAAMTTFDKTTKTALQHIQAQSLYHLRDFRGARKVYHQMFTEAAMTPTQQQEQQQMQILTNLSALACSSAVPFVQGAEDQLAPYRSTLASLLDTQQEAASDHIADLALNVGSYDALIKQPTPDNDAKLASPSELLQFAVETTQRVGKEEGWTADEMAKELAPVEWNLEWSQLLWSGSMSTARSTASKPSTPSGMLVSLANKALATAGVAKDALRLLPKAPSDKLTPLQNNLLYYNRGVLQYRAQLYSECEQSCAAWQSFLQQQARGSSAGGVANSKKKSANSNENGKSSQQKQAPQTQGHGPLLMAIEVAWWTCRVAVLQALCLMASSDKEGEKEKSREKAIRRIQEQLDHVLQISQSNSSGSTFVRDHSILYLKTHMALLEHGALTSEKTLEVLQSLPKSICHHQAYVASLASLHHQKGNEKQAVQVLKDSGNESALADFLLTQGQYNEVVELFESSTTDQDDPVAIARYVQALSFVDPAKAQTVWSEFGPDSREDGSEEGDDSMTGEDLEKREIPRFKSRALVDGVVGLAESNATNQKPKRSHDAVLRRRARKREEYLAKLDQKGVPRQTKPDPERWLPKYERSYARRRKQRGGGGPHKGAQGGISERDAAKLDVAARQAARAAGEDGTSGRSTAHMTAVSSGTVRKGGRKRY